MFKVVRSFASELGRNPEEVEKTFRYLFFMYDKFVHGAYITTMELYDGRSHSFMLRGHEWGEKRRVYKSTIASKLHEVLAALMDIAYVMNMSALVSEIGHAAMALYGSGEMYRESSST